jgi:hypothetical protein
MVQLQPDYESTSCTISEQSTLLFNVRDTANTEFLLKSHKMFLRGLMYSDHKPNVTWETCMEKGFY